MKKYLQEIPIQAWIMYIFIVFLFSAVFGLVGFFVGILFSLTIDFIARAVNE